MFCTFVNKHQSWTWFEIYKLSFQKVNYFSRFAKYGHTFETYILKILLYFLQ